MSRQLLISRLTSSLESGTPGVIRWADEDMPTCLSLEDPWRNNKKNISCIPAGDYICKPYDSPTHGATFQVMNVRGRTYILFHRGNTDEDTEGCVLVGSRWGTLRRGRGVLGSSQAWDRWWPQVREMDAFRLSVGWAGGVAPTLEAA